MENWRSRWSREPWWSRQSREPWRSGQSREPWWSGRSRGLSGRDRTGSEFMNDLHGRDRTGSEFRNGLNGCDRTDREFMNGLRGHDKADSYPLSTSRNQVLVQSQYSCRFLVGSTGEPFKNRLLFHRLESQYRARSYVTEYVSCFISLARPWQRKT